MSETLTEAERDDFPDMPYTNCQTGQQMVCTHPYCKDHERRDLRARLAAAEALADEWERQAEDPDDPAYKIGLFSAAGELRAALASGSAGDMNRGGA